MGTLDRQIGWADEDWNSCKLYKDFVILQSVIAVSTLGSVSYSPLLVSTSILIPLFVSLQLLFSLVLVHLLTVIFCSWSSSCQVISQKTHSKPLAMAKVGRVSLCVLLILATIIPGGLSKGEVGLRNDVEPDTIISYQMMVLDAQNHWVTLDWKDMQPGSYRISPIPDYVGCMQAS